MNNKNLQKKNLNFILAFLMILTFFILCQILRPSIYQSKYLAEITVYYQKGNLYKQFLSGPTEAALFQFYDGDFYVFDSHEDHRITMGALHDFFREEKKEVKDIFLVIHSHSTPVGFTPGNNKIFHSLKNMGFKGKFGIYYQFNHSVRFKKE